MSASFEIQSASGGYTVEIEAGLLARTMEAARDRAAADTAATTVMFADARFTKAYATLGLPMISVAAEESVKSLDAIPDLVIALRKYGATRRTGLIALGGGIVQDAAAFIASIYMRGISWTYVPTTLLGMADSCIGGKSSINVGPYKNIVGTYCPPARVLIDPLFTETLQPEQRAAGLIEAAKICYCRGTEAFACYMARNPSVGMSAAEFEPLVIDSLASKKWFIELDEFDRAERLLLNFGHTFGHALEGASHFDIEHGIAVGLGILCAIQVGPLLGHPALSAPRVQQLERHMRDLLSTVPRLRVTLGRVAIDDVVDRFRSDKKHGPEDYSIVGLREDGSVELVRLPRTQATLEAIATTLKTVMGSI